MQVSDVLGEALVLLFASVIVLLLSHRLRLPAVVGLLITGVLIGPSGLGLFSELAAVEVAAEIGVVFLLFAIGLEFSLDRLREIRRPFLLGGSVQSAATIALVALLAATAGGQPPLRAVFYGCLVALSSTAVVLTLYAARQELDAPQGKLLLGVLLFQDFLIVPMIVLTPVLAGTVEASPLAFALRFGGGVLAVAVVFLVARHLMPRLIRQVAATRIRELFVLGALLVGLGMAFFTEHLGFSLALGAFLAGIVVSESEYSHQVVADVAPFRDVFTSVFFISIGMLVDLRFAAAHAGLVLALTAAVVAVKAVTGAGAAAVLGLPVRIAAIAALGLAQIGEFSFVLLNVGRANRLVDGSAYQLVIVVAVLTMLITPALVAAAPLVGERIAAWLRRPAGGAVDAGADVQRHVIVVGFGLNGRTLARVLREAGIAYVVVELDGEAVRRGMADGEPILYGDATRREILEHAGIAAAEVVVFAISDRLAVRHSIALARQLNPNVHIIVRTRSHGHVEELRRCGADEVIAEELEAAIEIFTSVLAEYHVPRNVIHAQVRLLRGEGYRMLRGPSLRGEVSQALLDVLAAGTTDIYRLEPKSPAAGRTLRELELRQRTGATVIAVVRDGTPLPNPDGELHLEAGDTLVLVGSHAEIERAFALLEPPAID
ncbi:MAG TPA: cation:proton antiporter [Thermoanaerobaculia bacterium]|jgi:CPA2 family monovalent cation:H+ antiporter-2|nr:cation:proton antiporter [Thermoanaerobaculia bacterium]